MGLQDLIKKEKSGGLQSLRGEKGEREKSGLNTLAGEDKKTFRLPDFLGGGEFFKSTEEPVTTERNVDQETKNRIRGGSFQDTDKEIDHIVPKSLGGTDSPSNLQALESELSLTQKIGSLFGKEYSPGERPKEKRQEGKMVKEWEAIDQYKSGEISLGQARQRVLNWEEPKGTSDYFLESLIEAPGDIVKGISDWMSKDKGNYDYEEELSEQDLTKPTKERFDTETTEDAEDEADDVLSAREFGQREGEKFQDMLKEVGQALARSVVAGGAQAPEMPGADKIRDILGVKDRIEQKGFLQNEYVPRSKFERALLGTDEPISITSMGREYPGGDKMPQGLAFAVGLMDVGLNLVPGGSSPKTVAKRIARSSDDTIIKNALKTVFSGSDEVLDIMAKRFAKEKDPSRIEGALSTIKAKKIKERKDIVAKMKKERKRLEETIKKEAPKIANIKKGTKRISYKIGKIYKNLDDKDIQKSSKILAGIDSTRKVRQELEALEIKDSLKQTGTFPTKTGEADIIPVAGQKKITVPDIDNKLKRLKGDRFKITMGKGKGNIEKIDKATENLRKQKNDILAKEDVAFFTDANGKSVPAIREKSGIVAEKEWGTYDFKDVGGPTDNLTSWATTADNLTYGEGVGPAWKFASHAYMKVADRNDFISEMSMMSNKILKDNGMLNGAFKTPRKKDMEIIYDILDGKKRIKGSTAKHRKTAKDIRKLLDETHRQANETRAMLGKEPIGYIDNYISHIEKTNAWRELLETGRARASENLDYVIPNEKYNPFIKERLGKVKNKEKNIAKVLDSYFSSMANEVHITPLIEKTKITSKVLKHRGYTKSSGFLDKWTQTALVGKPSSLDISVGLRAGSKTRKITEKYNHARTLGALVGNLKWWLFTQPMSMANTVKEVGLMDTAGGIVDWMVNPALRREIKNTPSMRLKGTAGAGETMMGQLDKNASKLYKSKIDRYNDLLGVNIDFMENHLTGASMAAGLRHAKKYGLKGEDATLLADYTGQVTQSMYNKEARPQMLQSLATKTAFPMQTFNVEMWRHLKNMAGKGGGIPRTAQQRAKNIINFAVGTMIVNHINERATGRKLITPGSFIPLVGSYVDDLGGQVMNSVLGRLGVQEREASQGMRRNIIAPFEDGKQLARAFTDVFDHGDFSKMRELLIFWGMGGAGAAGGGQVNKMIDGLIATQQEEVKRITGETMFEIDGVDEKTRAILLGPYNTRAAREYFEPSEDDDALNLDSDIDLDNSELNLEEDLNLEEEIKL